MKRRLLNILLVLLLVICMVPVAVSADAGNYTLREKTCSHNDGATSLGYVKEPTCQEKGIAAFECDGIDWLFIFPIPCSVQFDREVDTLPCTIENLDAVEPTCTNSGLTAGVKCTYCEAGNQCAYCAMNLAEQTAIDAIGHAYEFDRRISEPTCTESGHDVYKCANCGGSKHEYPAKLGHSYADVEEVPATCITPGTTAGKKCSVCGDEQGISEISATGNHDYEFEAQVKAPTCTEKGTNRERCKNCTASQLVYPKALGHTPADVAEVPATCVKTGTTAGKKCSVCEETLEGIETIPATGEHKYDNYEGPIEGEEPTCVESGKGKFRCNTCTKWAKKSIPELGHIDKVLDVIREPSCTVYSVIKYGCEREACGHTWYVETEALGHKEVTLDAVPATCTATGLGEGKKCSVCNKVTVEQEVLPMLSHTWKTIEAKPATCTEDGHNAYQECEACGTTQNKEIVKGGHKFENFRCTVCNAIDTSCGHVHFEITVTESTCTVAGSKMFKCNDCGYEAKEDLLLKDHTEVDKSYAATCSKKGLTHKVCGSCGKDLVKQETATIPHNYVNGVCSACGAASNPSCRHRWTRNETVKEATCTETGLQNVVCTSCSFITRTNVIPKISHKTVTEIVKHATCTEAGQQKETCSVCGQVSVKEIKQLSHNYMNGVCSGCGQGDPNKVTVDLQDVFIVG